MVAAYDDGIARLYCGDVRAVLAEMAAESVQCVVTSPPYWGLRDYGAVGQLGLEEAPEQYVASMVAVFREVRRVLRSDGVLWLNLGDSYASSPPGNTTQGVSGASTLHGVNGASGQYRDTLSQSVQTKRNTVAGDLKPKDLIGIPWRVAFALQADGWYLRCDVIWSKPNPMPESVTDRPTKAHEYLFLLTKSARYFYDADAIREQAVATNHHDATGTSYHAPGQAPQRGNRFTRANTFARSGAVADHVLPGQSAAQHRADRTGYLDPAFGRNKRSVWTIATQPYPDAHFATFPEALVEPCILAGSRSEDTVLDPFAGSGTTLAVAKRLNRNAVGIELNPAYIALAAKRIRREGAQVQLPA